MTVIFHVDDLLGGCVLSEALEDLYEVLIIKYKKVKVTRGKIHPYLGMIMNLQHPGIVMIGNPGYMSDLVKEYGESTPMTTPADEKSDAKRFHSFAAKLLYLSKRTRPDILTLVAFLTTRVQSPIEDDRAKLHRGMGYIIRTIGLSLTLEVEGPISDSICGHIICHSHF